MDGSFVCSRIEAYRQELISLSDRIWENPEGPYQEYKASAWAADVLKEHGFRVVLGAGGIPTAVKATFGSGKPVIGFLGEYDALPGLSQEREMLEEAPVPGQAYGHGCGHNLMCAANVGAVIALKDQMQKENLPGTIVFYGCPAEEILTGKPLMARAGLFNELDAALAFHPMECNMTTYGNMVALDMVKFHFKGISAHASADPYNGRSALDAVELMNVGANYMREHIRPDEKIHYMITECGKVPNIIPDKACVWYYIRADKRTSVEKLFQRLHKIAQGAALMTETDMTVEYLGGCYECLNNRVLEDAVYDAMLTIPQEPWTEKEMEIAGQLNRQYAEGTISRQQANGLPADMQLHTGVLPMQTTGDGSSSDVGDVAHIVPTAFFTTACNNIGAPGHHWQITACAGNSIGHKGMIYAAKVLAKAALELLTKPEILQKARQEFIEATNGMPYKCPLPDSYQIPE